ncbi:MAG: transaldolase [Vicinamibacterales bacterium]
MASASDLRVKLFADGADLDVIRQMAANPLIKGFTTNPTLMKTAGVTDYAAFAREMLAIVPDRPISFEVFSDDFSEMASQALEIASWGSNVFVKIPVTNTAGTFAGKLIASLSGRGVQLNVTALLTAAQVEQVAAVLSKEVASYISVFAGRIADTGIDPMPIMRQSLDLMRPLPKAELIWASPRELLNVVQADEVGCHVITATSDVLAKLPLIGKDLAAFSLDTVKMFRQDAVSAGFSIAGRVFDGML